MFGLPSKSRPVALFLAASLFSIVPFAAGAVDNSISKELAQWSTLQNNGNYTHFGVLTSGAFNGKWEHFFIQYSGFQHTSRYPGYFLNQGETTGIRFNYHASSKNPTFDTLGIFTVATGANFDSAINPSTNQKSSAHFNPNQVAEQSPLGGECRVGSAGFIRERVNGLIVPKMMAIIPCFDYANRWSTLVTKIGTIAADGKMTWQGRTRPEGDVVKIVDDIGNRIPIFDGSLDRESVGSLLATYGKIKQDRKLHLYASAYLGSVNFILKSKDYGQSWTPKVIACGIDPSRLDPPVRFDAVNKEIPYSADEDLRYRKSAYTSQLRVCNRFALALGQRPTEVAVPVDIMNPPAVVQGVDYPVLSSDLSELAIEKDNLGGYVALSRLDGDRTAQALITLSSTNGISWITRGTLPLKSDLSKGQVGYGNVSPMLSTVNYKDPNSGETKTYLLATVSRRDNRGGEVQYFMRSAHGASASGGELSWSKPVNLAHNIVREEAVPKCVRDKTNIVASRHGYQDHWLHPGNGYGYIVVQHEIDDCRVETKIRPINVTEMVRAIITIPK